MPVRVLDEEETKRYHRENAARGGPLQGSSPELQGSRPNLQRTANPQGQTANPQSGGRNPQGGGFTPRRISKVEGAKPNPTKQTVIQRMKRRLLEGV